MSVDSTILGLITIVVGAIGAWNKTAFSDFRKRIVELEKEVKECHEHRLDEAIMIGGMKQTIAELNADVEAFKRRLDNDENQRRTT